MKSILTASLPLLVLLAGSAVAQSSSGANTLATTLDVYAFPKDGQAAEHQAQQSTETARQATAEQVDNFKKAFSVCLETKEYLFKY